MFPPALLQLFHQNLFEVLVNFGWGGGGQSGSPTFLGQVLWGSCCALCLALLLLVGAAARLVHWLRDQGCLFVFLGLCCCCARFRSCGSNDLCVEFLHTVVCFALAMCTLCCSSDRLGLACLAFRSLASVLLSFAFGSLCTFSFAFGSLCTFPFSFCLGFFSPLFFDSFLDCELLASGDGWVVGDFRELVLLLLDYLQGPNCLFLSLWIK